MKQKDIFLANLNPAKGREQQGIRPVVVISGNTMNKYLNICIVCPLSSRIKNYQGCIVLKKNNLTKLDKDSEVISFQVRTISQERLIQKIGEISDSQLQKLMQGLNEIMRY